MPTKKLPLHDYSPWSPSKAALAGRCGLAFKYRYLDKVEGGPRGSAAKIGVTVHLAQELALGGVDAGEAIDRSLVEVDEELTNKEKDKVRTFTASVEGFVRRIHMFKESHAVKRVFTEQRWAITADLQPCDFFDKQGMIRGIVDYGLLLESGALLIIDHKSGRQRSLENYLTQLNVYSVMGVVMYPVAKSVQCALNFMATESIVWGTARSNTYVTGVLQPWLQSYLNKQAVSVSSFSPRTGWHCKWCDYRKICTEKA